MRVFSRAWGDTWSLITSHWKRSVFGVFLFPLGLLLGFLFLEEEEVKDEAVILILFTIGPFVAAAIVVFLWNLWLAPYKLMGDKLDEVASNVHSLGTVVKAPEAPDWERWKRVPALKLYQVAELCGGISPGVGSAVARSNDASRAIYSELEEALRSDDLKGSHEPKWANEHTRIKRKDLQEYFSGRDDYPAFLKE